MAEEAKLTTLTRFEDLRSKAGHWSGIGQYSLSMAREPRLTSVTRFEEVRSVVGHHSSIAEPRLGTGRASANTAPAWPQLKLTTIIRFEELIWPGIAPAWPGTGRHGPSMA